MIRRRTFAAVAASAALIAGCGGSTATTTTTAGGNEATSKASLARKHERQHLIAEGRQVVGCLRQAGYRRVFHETHDNTPFFSVRGNGVVAPIVVRYGSLVVKTGLQNNNGVYAVGIASTPKDALTYLGGNLGFPGGSAFDGSYDGSVTLISSGGTRNLAPYKSDRAKVAACGFSVPGASGYPKPAPKRFR